MSNNADIVKVKICGLTRPAQAREIARMGADYIGCIIEFPKSPRSVNVDTASEIREAVEGNGKGAINRARTVGVVVNLPVSQLVSLIEDTGIGILQLHGEETPEYVKKTLEKGVKVWKTVTPGDYARYAGTADKFVVDARNPEHGAGGSGRLADWDFARQLIDEGYSVVLSGGLTSENVQEGITFSRSRIVDSSSGVETCPGIKDLKKVERFIKSATSLSFRI